MMRERIAHPRSTVLLSPALIVLGVVVLAACVAPPTPTPTPTPTATPRPAIAEDDWTRIEDAGVIEVASPLDNAPFNMYDEDRNPDGFDVALMRELARRLGLRVKFIDVPFEGLLSALRLGQADAAIAAMAVTRDRLAQVAFTQTYYVGEDGILAAPDSDISAVQTKADVINRRVGVVRGTVYEWWLRQNLIETGEMPATNLHVYTRPDDAVRELGEGRIDLVVLDREPALTYEAQGLGRLVGKSQYTQNFAIPLRQGSTLLRHLNAALAAALADGTVAGLIEQYLNIDPDDQLPVPTPSPQPAEVPTATLTPAGAAPPVECDSGTGYGQPLDLTVPDGTQMQPGRAFEKRWRIVNVGTCDWTAGYSFIFANKGERLGGQDAYIGKTVPKGSSHDVSVAMVAPSAPGKHWGYWQVADAKGEPFGKQVYVEIVVLAPSPTPTQAPPTNISWSVDRDHIKQGESAYFTLNVTGVKQVWFNEKGQPYVGVKGQSTQKVTPPRDTTYQLRVEQNDGRFWQDERTIYVAQAVGAPVIAQFGINPQYEVVAGQPVTLWWEVKGVADGVALLRDGVQLQQTTAVQSSFEDKPPAGDPVTYELRAWGPGGSANPAYQQIRVKREPVQAPPVITQFDSNPQGELVAGNCLDLYWEVQGAVDRVELVRNGAQLPNGGLVSSYHDCPPDVGAYTYELHASGPGGNASPRSLSINVIGQVGPPGNPATQNCLDRGGQHVTAQRGDGGEYGICLFEDNQQCEEWALMRGECPIGGVNVTGYSSAAARYCAITGGQYAATGNQGAEDEQGICSFSTGAVCDVWAYYNGQCGP